MNDDETTTPNRGDLEITHDHADGTVLHGSSKGDGVLEIVQRHGFGWGRDPGIHIRGSRDKDARTSKIDGAALALRAAGWSVTVTVDNTSRTAAEREAGRELRATHRAGRLTDRAAAAAAKAEATDEAGQRIRDGYPMGQPVQPPGHHSRGRHLRNLNRADTLDQRARDGCGYVRHLASRASGVESNEDAKHSPRAIMRRIQVMEADVRGWERRAGEPGTSADYKERAGREVARLAEDIAHQRAKLAKKAESGEFVPWGPEHFKAGDLVSVLGDWLPVRRVNKKSVSVPGGYGMAGNDASWNATVTWDKVHGRRRDGMQLDTPNGREWPVEVAAKVSLWASLCGAAGRLASNDGQRAGRARVEMTQRLMFGLPLDAADAEVSAYLDALPGDEDSERAFAVACVDVYRRLKNGEKADAIRADLVPWDVEPAWKMPATEPEDRRAGPGWLGREDGRQVRPGDVIRGFYDRGFAGSRSSLVRSFCGPVEHVSAVKDRREAGEWVTVTLTTGESRVCRAESWFSVHPAAQVAQEPAAEPETAAGLEALTAEMFGRQISAHDCEEEGCEMLPAVPDVDGRLVVASDTVEMLGRDGAPYMVAVVRSLDQESGAVVVEVPGYGPQEEHRAESGSFRNVGPLGCTYPLPPADYDTPAVRSCGCPANLAAPDTPHRAGCRWAPAVTPPRVPSLAALVAAHAGR